MAATASTHIALARYRAADVPEPTLGLVAQERIRRLESEDFGSVDLNTFLADPDWDRLRQLASDITNSSWRDIAEVELLAPVQPRQVIQTGANYRTHVIELVVAGLSEDDPRTPEEARAWAADIMDARKKHGEPYFFIGLPACLAGNDEPLHLPTWSEAIDWELELAVVIGREAYQVSSASALDHVAGYTIVNDITARDFVFREDMKDIGTDWYRGKNAPGFLPTGPWLVPADQIDPANVHIELRLNGEVMQQGHTSDLLFDIPELISAASQTMPLLPGDLLLTGSPQGNGIHHGRFLRAGDTMTGSITGLGTQQVRCI